MDFFRVKDDVLQRFFMLQTFSSFFQKMLTVEMRLKILKGDIKKLLPIKNFLQFAFPL